MCEGDVEGREGLIQVMITAEMTTILGLESGSGQNNKDDKEEREFERIRHKVVVDGGEDDPNSGGGGGEDDQSDGRIPLGEVLTPEQIEYRLETPPHGMWESDCRMV